MLSSANKLWQRCFALVVFTALFLLIGSGTVSYAQITEPATEHPGQTVPPLKPFEKKVLSAKVRPGTIVEYEITINNSSLPTYTGSLIGITDTLPVELFAFEPITASHGTATWINPHLITWTGELAAGDKVKITYPVLVSPNLLTTTLTNTATLWEIKGPTSWITPTTQTLTARAIVQVQPTWPEAYLPNISVAAPAPTPLPPINISQLGNWNFEAGRNGAWIENSNNSPGKMIYRNGEKITLVLPPYQNQPNNYFAWLGGEYSAVNILEQRITLPADLKQMSFMFDAWIESADDCGKDTAEVFVNNTLVKTYQLCRDNNSPVKPVTGGWNRQLFDITRAGALTGQPVAVTFKVTTDAAKNSNWYIDNVRFCSTDPRAAQADRCE